MLLLSLWKHIRYYETTSVIRIKLFYGFLTVLAEKTFFFLSILIHCRTKLHGKIVQRKFAQYLSLFAPCEVFLCCFAHNSFREFPSTSSTLIRNFRHLVSGTKAVSVDIIIDIRDEPTHPSQAQPNSDGS